MSGERARALVVALIGTVCSLGVFVWLFDWKTLIALVIALGIIFIAVTTVGAWIAFFGNHDKS